MPLNLDEVPMDAIFETISKRYPSVVMVGVNETFAGPDKMTDMVYISGNVLLLLGLVEIVKDQLMEQWAESYERPTDTP